MGLHVEENLTVEISNVELSVSVGSRPSSLKSLLVNRKHPTVRKLILNVPHFIAREGDRICVIGKNGNGKTTFMKVLAGIFTPTRGQVWTRSKPTAVLAAGIGMEDELTVEENIDVSLLLRNLTSGQIRELKRGILEFCELTTDANKQFKHLSTGYRSRLAFATAICETPRILLLDEVLGGGDEFFMKKANSKLHETIAVSQTAFIATHGPDEFDGVCNRVLVIEEGRITFDGEFSKGVDFYRKSNS
ncbi:ATP-binding cassette domain-containing protein [Cohaesibacter sp. ES.047]|uniref:ATP-binding cassette domain-containing protein n=1 Tax=Cohaesibacter sp. ES.047 TaxID=1798205 RepID=UPI0012FDCFB6|nr:ATP-binding cassette domain-containing protein [Cohaesibacter sp. ES.047]